MSRPTEGRAWIRKVGLLVTASPVVSDLPLADDFLRGMDLSELRFRFDVWAADVETPNNCAIRIYNLSDHTLARVRGEYNRVILQAGYEHTYGVIFDGTIKQFRIGKENATDKYLDILAADGDIGYTQGVVNTTLAGGSTFTDHAKAAARAMGVKLAHMPTNNFMLPRGKVLFGMAAPAMRRAATNMGATWWIQNGEVHIVPLEGYLPGEAVVINSLSGMIGIPEQTDQGIGVTSLLNPRLRIGGLIRLNNDDINRLQINSIVPFNKRVGLVQSAPLSADGLYRLLVVEHMGDTRGNEWYSEMIGLAVDASTDEVVPGAAGP